MTIGSDGDPHAIGPQPGNVRVERFVPQSAVLPHAAAFVSHGGSGALLGAVRAGVPMLAIPQGADQFLNAERIVASGMGLRLMPADLAADTVRSSVRRLLEEPGFATAVGVIRDEIDGMPEPEAVVARLARGA